jgi:antitoxin component YwqK of YwqJK toxin-antitoxin module
MGGDSIEPFRVLVYNEDGKLNYQGTYKKGLLFLDNKNRPYSGGISVYYKNGNLFTHAEYKAGKPDGTLKQWDAKGNLVKTEIYQNGILTGIRRY